MPPREFVARIPKTGGYRLSPDGTKMIYWQRSLLPIHWWRSLVPFKKNYYIKTFSTGEVQKHPNLHEAKGIYWSADSTTIIYSTNLRKDGDYYNQLIATDITTTEPNKIPLAPMLSQQGRMYFHKSIKGSKEIVLRLKSRDRKQYFHAPAYYRVDYTTGQYTKLATASPRLRDWIISDKGDVLGSYRTNISGFDVQWRVDGEDHTLFSCDDDNEINYLTSDSQFVYFLSDCLSDKVAVNRFNRQTYNIETLHERDNVDIDSIAVDKQSGKLLFAITNNHTTEFIALDKRFTFLQDWYKKNQSSQTLAAVSNSDDWSKFVISSSDLTGWRVKLVDNETQQITTLEEQTLPGKQSRVGSYQAIEIPTESGIAVRAFLARPSFIAPDLKIPTVIYLHGGPRTRSYPTYNPEVSFLTNRGYAVLMVNYHGSTGYGKDYMRLPYGNFTSLPNSVSAAVDWLLDSGSADSDKLALMGYSYGGYLSLLMPSLDNRFACSVAVNAASDASKLITEDKNNFGVEEFTRYFSRSHYHGHSNMEYHNTWSPIEHDYAGYKMLLVHAEFDRRIPIEQSEKFYRKFRSSNEIKFVTLANESHGVEFWTSRLRILRESEKFLGQCLGGAKGGFDYYSIVEPLSRVHFMLFE
jgi:dipeptidyl aminopeptidase/acylaminoacyl peptidase